VIVLLALLVVAWCVAAGQDGSAVSSEITTPGRLITQPVDGTRLTVLNGNTHPLARQEFDQGIAPASLPMERMELVLKRSAEQESALRTLLDSQQDKGSANYHKWLTPEQFGKQFGPVDSDVQAVTAWLRSCGFQVAAVSKGRTTIEFSGSASQVQQAFHTAIHKYKVNGEEHWANASDPSIPSALAPAVKGVLSLHNFPRRSYATVMRTPLRPKARETAALPLFTYTQQDTSYYGLGPTDFATIYNVLPLWNAGIDGTGQTIAIVGQTDIHLTDVEDFRTLFGLPANDPTIILNGPDPGVDGDETEALLDVSWSGAVAKNATIDLVVSAATEASLGVDLSALYIVDNNIAPVMSDSYGICEATLGNAGNAFYNALWEQAAAQGITVLVAAGDGGSAGCDNFQSEEAAVDGLAVSGFASTPYNVALGGTDFNQSAATAPNYWNATNDPNTGASAKSYIPETTWNDSCAGLGIDQCTYSSDFLDIVGGSGGPSSCSTQDSGGTCLSGYGKPSWQSGTGVPSDGVRDLPDVSLFASNGFNNSFYIVCEADAGFFGTQEVCSLATDTFVGVGGTSASAPTFAGIMALVNQKMAAQGSSPRQGNANYVLYKLAAQNGASCNSSTVALTGNACIFYDITQGNNSVPCNPDTPNCGTAPADGFGVLVDPNNPGNPAWLATTGYDMATGLGSVNANNLVNQWSGVSFKPSTTTLTSLTPTSITHGQPVSVSATVAAQSGTSTPTGAVALMATPTGQNLGAGVFPLNNGVANGTTTLLPGGTYNVTAYYPGDSTFGASDSAPVQVTVGKENSQTKETLVALNPTTYGFQQIGDTVPYGTIFFLRSDVTNAAGAACAPNPQLTQVQCPTGSVSFTSNGKTLDAGSYALNTEGYTEDQTLASDFTALGSYALQAQYSGDNSYNPNTSTLNMTVTQGETDTEIEIPNLSQTYNGTNLVWIADSGQTFTLDTVVYAWSILQAPTGSIAVLENGNAVAGTISYTPRNGSISGNYSTGVFEWAYLAGYLQLTIDTPGNYIFTAAYSGDPYYLGTQSAYSIPVTVLDTTFNISTPIANVTISAPGQSGTATVTLVGVDNFIGGVSVTCALPASMTEASCPSASASLLGSSVAAQLTITTTAPHTVGSDRRAGVGYGMGILAGVFLFAIAVPSAGMRRRRMPLAMLLFGCVALIGSCGGGSKAPPPQMDPGTPAGTYTVNVTATSTGITRTGSFTVTVQ